MATIEGGAASTPEATAGVAQTKDVDPNLPSAAPAAAAVGQSFSISPQVTRHASHRGYPRTRLDPVYRPLRIFALDPGVSKLEGAIALVNVPYEPLKVGPRGCVFHVKSDQVVCNLEDRAVLLQQGYAPSRSDKRFHHQMVYAVCSSVYAAFKAALGRDPVWGFVRGEDSEQADVPPGVLVIQPHAFAGRNAYYDKSDGTLCFGYFTAEETTDDLMKGETVYTCLSHDVISHELTHALLDGLRAHFTLPTRIDVLAFHEAFADLVAVMQHFTYRDVVLTAIRKSRGTVTDGLLTDLARPLGPSSGNRASALRSALDPPAAQSGRPRQYNPELPVHDLGAVLLAAVFDAFNVIYKRKTARYIKLATAGSGELPVGQLPQDLQEVLAEEASQLASQFLSICIRAIDYCPPVDLELGEFLRAVITADRELVPDDPWGYREAWIDAFRDRGIVPSNVDSLDEESLTWRPPETRIKPLSGLSFGRLRFNGDPARPAGARELRRQAKTIGSLVANPRHAPSFGLVPIGQSGGCPPEVHSIRSARRVGPDGQIVFDIVAELTQRCVMDTKSGRRIVVHGGSTVILGPQGEVRYVIGKGSSRSRVDALANFAESDRGSRFWLEQDGELTSKPAVLGALHNVDG
jgi:hypothetical protein